MILNSNEYMPLQPGLEQITFRYWKPPLNHFQSKLPVILFYEFKINAPDHEYVSILPDACVEIIFELNPSKPTALIGGSVLKNKEIRFLSGIQYFGIRLLPEYGIKLPDDLIIDETIPSSFFVKQEHLIEQMLMDSSLQNCIRLFNHFIHSDAFTTRSVPGFIPYSIQQSYLNRGNIEINQLAEKTGYTVQYFRKKFEQYTGLTPKLFNRIIRFQSSLNNILNQNSNLLDIVEEYGYYDQAHLIREYRKFNYLTPLQVKKTIKRNLYPHISEIL
ncbi:helix-turn-helix domain-containing protein [Priestia aryabhattai]|uniref:helix-turn-helix domain-containing protein n=1 Tax=Priestia aryabhattai TaxID=412384 RepID=UPI001CCFB981|nr:AraC family transcriptional regulator [Priestia aryabhattai]MBZ6489483.1 AraC family transcriptional regulator [Priestia aryabhattai]